MRLARAAATRSNARKPDGWVRVERTRLAGRRFIERGPFPAIDTPSAPTAFGVVGPFGVAMAVVSFQSANDVRAATAIQKRLPAGSAILNVASASLSSVESSTACAPACRRASPSCRLTVRESARTPNRRRLCGRSRVSFYGRRHNVRRVPLVRCGPRHTHGSGTLSRRQAVGSRVFMSRFPRV